MAVGIPRGRSLVIDIAEIRCMIYKDCAAHNMLFRQSTGHLSYKSCLADPDIWMRPAVKDNNSHYYEYLAIYVDDTLCISHDPMKTMEAISKLYRIKDNSIEPPKTYLGAQVLQYKLPNDNSKIRWAMSSQHYIANVIVKRVKRV